MNEHHQSDRSHYSRDDRSKHHASPADSAAFWMRAAKDHRGSRRFQNGYECSIRGLEALWLERSEAENSERESILQNLRAQKITEDVLEKLRGFASSLPKDAHAIASRIFEYMGSHLVKSHQVFEGVLLTEIAASLAPLDEETIRHFTEQATALTESLSSDLKLPFSERIRAWNSALDSTKNFLEKMYGLTLEKVVANDIQVPENNRTFTAWILCDAARLAYYLGHDANRKREPSRAKNYLHEAMKLGAGMAQLLGFPADVKEWHNAAVKELHTKSGNAFWGRAQTLVIGFNVMGNASIELEMLNIGYYFIELALLIDPTFKPAQRSEEKLREKNPAKFAEAQKKLGTHREWYRSYEAVPRVEAPQQVEDSAPLEIAEPAPLEDEVPLTLPAIQEPEPEHVEVPVEASPEKSILVEATGPVISILPDRQVDSSNSPNVSILEIPEDTMNEVVAILDRYSVAGFVEDSMKEYLQRAVFLRQTYDIPTLRAFLAEIEEVTGLLSDEVSSDPTFFIAFSINLSLLYDLRAHIQKTDLGFSSEIDPHIRSIDEVLKQAPDDWQNFLKPIDESLEEIVKLSSVQALIHANKNQG